MDDPGHWRLQGVGDGPYDIDLSQAVFVFTWPSIQWVLLRETLEPLMVMIEGNKIQERLVNRLTRAQFTASRDAPRNRKSSEQ